jgi:hypothetical protein
MVVSLEESDDLEQENVNSLLAQPSLRASSGVPKTTVWTIKSGWLALNTGDDATATSRDRTASEWHLAGYKELLAIDTFS